MYKPSPKAKFPLFFFLVSVSLFEKIYTLFLFSKSFRATIFHNITNNFGQFVSFFVGNIACKAETRDV